MHYVNPPQNAPENSSIRWCITFMAGRADPNRTPSNILSLLNENADVLRDRIKIELRVGTEDVLYCDNEILHLHLDLLRISTSKSTAPTITSA